MMLKFIVGPNFNVVRNIAIIDLKWRQYKNSGFVNAFGDDVRYASTIYHLKGYRDLIIYCCPGWEKNLELQGLTDLAKPCNWELKNLLV